MAQSLSELDSAYGARNYLPLPVILARGEGSWVWDVSGKKYLDFLSTYSALNFGHSHPDLVRALKMQVDKLAVCSRAFMSEELIYFCKDLAQFCSMEAVLPMNSGTEAVETALKVARKWGAQVKQIPSERSKIIVMRNNFHGRSISIISFSTEPTYREGFGPYTPGFEIIPFGDVNALERACTDDTIAVLLEPIQAEAGVLIPPKEYLSSVRAICRRSNALLILDEIQTGLGRTGREFCYQYESIQPDILVLGKSLGGGLLPLSAIVTKRDIINVIQPGQHGSTFGGNPLAVAVGRRALGLIRELELCKRAIEIGEIIKGRLTNSKISKIKEIRGVGALIGVELESSAGTARPFCERLAEKGVLCKETHDNVIRIAPPLTTEHKDLHWGIDRIIEVLQ